MPLTFPRVARCLSTDYVAKPASVAQHFAIGLRQDGYACDVGADPSIPGAFRLTMEIGDYAIFRPTA